MSNIYVVKPDYSAFIAKTNSLVGDSYFQQFPNKILGTTTTKKRGDRGADAIEEVVEGSLESVLAKMKGFIGNLDIQPGSIGANNSEAERLRLLGLNMQIELDLLELELELELEVITAQNTAPEKAQEVVAATVLVGKSIVITLPNGETRKGAFAIIELDNLIASHNERTFSTSKGYPTNNKGENINDRNYAQDTGAQAKVKMYAQQLDPAQVISTSRNVSGTPIVTKDNIVVSGNNRTMSLKLAESDYPQNILQYFIYLEEEINAFGFKSMVQSPFTEYYDIEANDGQKATFKAPILVRIDYDFPEYTTTELSKYNRSEMKSERPVDRAIRLSNSLREQFRCYGNIADTIGGFDTMTEFYASRKAEKEVVEYLQSCNVVTNNDLAAIYDHAEGFNSNGKELLESVLSSIVLEKDALIASSMEGVKRLRGIIITSLPILAKHATLDGNYIADLNTAVVLQKRIHASGLGFKEYISKMSMFDAKPSRASMIINRLFDKGRGAFKTAFDKFNTQHDINRKPSLFGDKKTPNELFDFYFAKSIDPSDLAAIDLSVKK